MKGLVASYGRQSEDTNKVISYFQIALNAKESKSKIKPLVYLSVTNVLMTSVNNVLDFSPIVISSSSKS